MKQLISSAILLTIISCSSSTITKNGQAQEAENLLSIEEQYPGASEAYFASGCFWCVEAVFESVNGVHEAISGYAGGTTKNPTYNSVTSGRTGHAETVQVIYDPSVLSFDLLLDVYYGSHTPTTVNGQSPDFGTSYRSIAFYSNEDEKTSIEDKMASLQSSGTYDKPIATEVKAYQVFYPAEAYHQNFEARNPNHRYIQAVSKPRLNRFKAKFPELLKKDSAH